MHPLSHLEGRLFGQPLMVDPGKLSTILSAVGPRILDGSSLIVPDVPPSAAAVKHHGSIAVLPIHGVMVNRASGMAALSGMTSYTALTDTLLDLATDPAVAGIILELDSLGGEAGGAFDLADMIVQVRQETVKPIWALASESALSAGYLLASACERLLVTQTGLVGSIGVTMAHVDRSGADHLRGQSWTFLHAGARKLDGNAHQPLSPEARAEFQRMLAATYSRFVEVVAKNRQIPAARVRATEAAVYHGARAVEAGLADGVSTLRQAIAEMAGSLDTRGTGRQSALQAPQAARQTLLQAIPEAPVLDALVEQQSALADLRLTAARLGSSLDPASVIRSGMSINAARAAIFDRLAAAQEATPVFTVASHPDDGSDNAVRRFNTADVYRKRAEQARG